MLTMVTSDRHWKLKGINDRILVMSHWNLELWKYQENARNHRNESSNRQKNGPNDPKHHICWQGTVQDGPTLHSHWATCGATALWSPQKMEEGSADRWEVCLRGCQCSQSLPLFHQWWENLHLTNANTSALQKNQKCWYVLVLLPPASVAKMNQLQ